MLGSHLNPGGFLAAQFSARDTLMGPSGAGEGREAAMAVGEGDCTRRELLGSRAVLERGRGGRGHRMIKSDGLGPEGARPPIWGPVKAQAVVLGDLALETG